MGAQSSLLGLVGTVAGAGIGAANIAGKIKSNENDKASNIKGASVKDNDNSGIDMQMAIKARKEAQAKINAIYANKEISNKAKTRRLGKVMDDYNKQVGGKK